MTEIIHNGVTYNAYAIKIEPSLGENKYAGKARYAKNSEWVDLNELGEVWGKTAGEAEEKMEEKIKEYLGIN